jgi:hypothetical protein
MSDKEDVKYDVVTVYLSRRNLLALLSKLDRKAKGEDTHCQLIKYYIKDDDMQQSHDEIHVIAIEDEIAYKNRNPGAVFPADLPSNR